MPPFAFRRRPSKSNLNDLEDELDRSYKTDRYSNIFEISPDGNVLPPKRPSQSDVLEGVRSGKMKRCALSMLEMSEIEEMKEFAGVLDSMGRGRGGGGGRADAPGEDEGDFLLIDDSERSGDGCRSAGPESSGMGGFFRPPSAGSGAGMRRSASAASFASDNGKRDLCFSSMLALPEIDEKEEELQQLKLSPEKDQIDSGVGEEFAVAVNFNDQQESPRIKSPAKESSAPLHELDQSRASADSNSLRSSLKRRDSNASLASASSANPEAPRPMKRNVSFSSLEIRSYNVTLGDAPTSNGPPVSLDWDYDPSPEVLDVDSYEKERSPLRRSKQEMLMPPSHRQYLLMREAGFTRGEIQKAVDEAKRVSQNRRRTAKNVKLQPVEEMLESSRRKFGRLIGRRGSKEDG